MRFFFFNPVNIPQRCVCIYSPYAEKTSILYEALEVGTPVHQ